MTESVVRVLLVEDNPADARLLRESLADEGERLSIEQRGSLAEALIRLDGGSVDAVLLDLGLPDSQGLETFLRVRTRSPGTPVVLLTGLDDDALARRALQRGAQDFVVKGCWEAGGLARALRFAIERKRGERLTRSNADLERFATAAAHDLQEPLRKILSYGGLLKRREEAAMSAGGRHLLESLLASAERMARMVSGLLAIYRLGDTDGVLRRVDLNGVLSDSLADLDGLIAESGPAAIELEKLPTVWGNPAQLRQLFQNLLSNALKFRAPGRPPRVWIFSRALHGDLVEVGVRDNGVGFDSKQADTVFSPFRRAGGPEGAPGSGIGLATCRAIALRHGGWITAQSEAGRGATFFVALPLRRME